MLIVDIVAIEAEASLQAERITSTKTSWHNTLGLASLKDSVPNLVCILREEVELEASAARVARIRDDHVGAVCEGSYLKVVVGYLAQVDVRQTLQYLCRLRALYG